MTIGIIGAGISGMSAALRLAKGGHTVEIFQRESEVGGLIATFDLAGTRTERFYHFLCAGDVSYFELCRELGLASRVRFTKPRTGFYYQGRSFPFTSAVDLVRFSPITLAQRIRFGLFALRPSGGASGRNSTSSPPSRGSSTVWGGTPTKSYGSPC